MGDILVGKVLYARKSGNLTKINCRLNICEKLGKISIKCSKDSETTFFVNDFKKLKESFLRGKIFSLEYIGEGENSVNLKKGDQIKFDFGMSSIEKEIAANKLKIAFDKFHNDPLDSSKLIRDNRALSNLKTPTTEMNRRSIPEIQKSCSFIGRNIYEKTEKTYRTPRSENIPSKRASSPFRQKMNPPNNNIHWEKLDEIFTENAKNVENTKIEKVEESKNMKIMNELVRLSKPLTSKNEKVPELKKTSNYIDLNSLEDSNLDNFDSINSKENLKEPLNDELVPMIKNEEPQPPVISEKLNENLEKKMNLFANRKLINIGNSCYMNATYQALSSLDTLMAKFRANYIEIFTNSKIMDLCSLDDLDLLRSICNILFKLCNCSEFYDEKDANQIDVNVLIEVRQLFGKKYKSFDNSDQQDAHEFLIFLMGFVEGVIEEMTKKSFECDEKENTTEWREKLKSESNLYRIRPTKELAVYTKTKMKCIHCENSREVYDSYTFNINVPILAENTFQELFDDTFPCAINYDIKCEKCEEKGVKLGCKISKFPRNLVVNLKRYQVTETSSVSKCDIYVPVEAILYTNQVEKYQETVREFEDFRERNENYAFEGLECIVSPTKTLSDVLNEKFDYDETINQPTRRRSSSFTHEEIFEKSIDSNENVIDDETIFGLIGTSPKLKGGGKEEVPSVAHKSESNDMMILEEKVYNNIPFKPWTNIEEVKEALRFCEIKEIRTELLQNHFKDFPEIIENEIDVRTKPTVIKQVGSDGNCFYRSISWWLTGCEAYHLEFRKANHKFIKNNSSLFVPLLEIPLEKFVKAIENDSEWSNEVEIIAMCTMLNLEIYTFLQKKWVRYQPRHHESVQINSCKKNGAIYLTNKHNLHYEPVISCEIITKKSRKRRSSMGNNEESDDEMPKIHENEYLNDEQRFGKARKIISRACKMQKSYCEEGNYENEIMQEYEFVDWKRAEGSPVYQLSAVVCHQGSSLYSGHYVALTRNSLTGKWLYCSDDDISEISEQEVLQTASAIGYVFYYSRINQKVKID